MNEYPRDPDDVIDGQYMDDFDEDPCGWEEWPYEESQKAAVARLKREWKDERVPKK